MDPQVGTYNPLATRSGVKEVTFKVDRVRYWVSVGAQPSDRVAWLLGQVRGGCAFDLEDVRTG